MAVGQEALASPTRQDYCGSLLTAIGHGDVSISRVESGPQMTIRIDMHS